MKANNKVVMITVGIPVITTILSATILSSTYVSADNDSVVDQINITVPVACTLSGTGMDSHNAEINNGQYNSNIGTTILKAFCNDNEGFSIYAVGYTDNEIGKNVLTNSTLGPTHDIVTGTATSGNNSNWAMKLAIVSNPTPTYPIIIMGSTDDVEKQAGDPDYSAFQNVPSSYAKVAKRESSTDVGTTAEGAALTTTYQAYISPTQAAGTYTGQVKYTMVHPHDGDAPLGPQQPTTGCISYFANASNAVGTMGCQSATDGNTVTLFASNFSRDGYGFAGWSDAFDYATNPNAHFYGPNEDITVPNGTTANGLALYAVWVKSVGTFQDSAKTASVCNSLTAASTSGARTLDSVSALTDVRDGQTYAIAKLADNKCWMIENLRLADTHTEGNTVVPTTLTTTNTNNPLNDNDPINPIVTLKHNYSDTQTFANLSPTSSVAYNESTAPEGWCKSSSAACGDQSRLRTDNTANRVLYQATDTMSASANLYSYGNYYNWYSATAGNGTYSFSTNNNSVDGDLCPAGWKLPIGGRKANVSTSDFWSLSRAVIGADPANFTDNNFYYTGNPEGTNASKLLRTYPNNLLYPGYVNGTSINYRGSDGSYWSSTASNSIGAYNLYLGSSDVSPGTATNNRYNGRPVRCLAAH